MHTPANFPLWLLVKTPLEIQNEKEIQGEWVRKRERARDEQKSNNLTTCCHAHFEYLKSDSASLVLSPFASLPPPPVSLFLYYLLGWYNTLFGNGKWNVHRTSRNRLRFPDNKKKKRGETASQQVGQQSCLLLLLLLLMSAFLMVVLLLLLLCIHMQHLIIRVPSIVQYIQLECIIHLAVSRLNDRPAKMKRTQKM